MMSRLSWDFTLLDTGFFRSGQPFHAGEGGYSRIASHFPPSMHTLQGAIRSALAAARGWQPGDKDSWPHELGDGVNLGLLSLQGPYLLWEKTPLFPAPLHLWIKKLPGKNEEPEIQTTFLVPGEDMPCDLNDNPGVPLPRKAGELEGGQLPENVYLTKSGYSAVSIWKGPSKEEVYFSEELWEEEPRIGLKRHPETRTAEDHNLYRIGHIRPDSRLSMRVLIKGLTSDWPEPKQKIVPLGGEGRLAAVEINAVTDDDYKHFLPPCPELKAGTDGNIRYTISLITPSSPEKMEQLIRRGPQEAPGSCISACIGKPLLYGGWDLASQKPRPLQPYLPPGSTWFFEAPEKEKSKIEALHGCSIKEEKAPSYGFGQVLIGKWEVEKK